MTTQNLFSNRATAKLAVDVASNDTALTLAAGTGVWFPVPAAGQFFRLVLQKGSGQTDQREYMTCTGVAGDVLTVTRAQEGTPAGAFAVGDEVSLVATALSLGAMVQRVGGTLQGALEVEANPTTPLGIATKQFVESGRLADAPADGKDYARKDTAWHALGAAAGLAVPIPISAGGTGGTTLPEAQTNLVVGVTTINDLAPATPKYGDRWIKPSNMTEMVWVPNAGGGGAGVWINPMDATSEAYPLAISKGGTGATDAATARLNLGVGGTIPFVLFDGTVAAPGLAWASEPGLGWYRPAAGVIAMAATGGRVTQVALNGGNTSVNYWCGAGGQSAIALRNQNDAAANQNILNIIQTAAGGANISTATVGSATRGNLTLDAPQVLHNDGTVAAPNISFASEPGLGFYRVGAGAINIASGGAVLAAFDSTSATQTTTSFTSRTAGGASFLNLGTAPPGSPNRNVLQITQSADGSARIATVALGTATRGNLTLDAPITFHTGTVSSNPPAGNSTIQALAPTNASAELYLSKGAENAFARIFGATGGLTRWQLNLGNAVNNFEVSRFNGAGTFLNSPLTIDFVTGNTTLQGTTTATVTPPSDERIKHDIEALAPIDFAAIQPISFKRNADPESGTHYGFSAQNLHRIAKPLVIGDFDTDAPAAIDPVGILALAVLEVQALINRVQQLECK